MKNIHVIPTDKPSMWYLDENKKLQYIPAVQYNYNNCVNIYLTSEEEITGFENNIWLYNNGRVWLWKNTMALNNNNKPKKIILTTDQDLIKDGVQEIPDEFLQWFVKNPSCDWVDVKDIYVCSNCNEDKNNPKYETCHGNYRTHKIYKIIIPKEESKCHGVISGCLKLVCDCESMTLLSLMKEEPKQREMFLMNANIIIDTRKPKQNIENHYLSTPNPLTDTSRMKLDNHTDLHKQETIEEAAERYSLELLEAKTIEPHEKTWIKSMFIHSAKWQAKRMYSEEEVLYLLLKRSFDLKHKKDSKTSIEWFEQYKKK